VWSTSERMNDEEEYYTYSKGDLDTNFHDDKKDDDE
jgi:hypothetical protein